MKTSIKTIAASIALTALMAGPASAMVSQSNVQQGIQSALGAGSNVFASVKDDTVTLTGYFESRADKGAAIRAANAAGADRVIDLTTVTN